MVFTSGFLLRNNSPDFVVRKGINNSSLIKHFFICFQYQLFIYLNIVIPGIERQTHRTNNIKLIFPPTCFLVYQHSVSTVILVR